MIAGIDPGHSGAIALYDGVGRRLVSVWDMPTFKKRVGRAERTRIDLVAVQGITEMLAALGTDAVYIEEVGGRGLQRGASEMGYGVGVLHMACVAARLQIELVQAQVWKRRMRAPADKAGSVQRAEMLFPQQREMFRGSRGGFLDGRAEAAMIAMYGAERMS